MRNISPAYITECCEQQPQLFHWHASITNTDAESNMGCTIHGWKRPIPEVKWTNTIRLLGGHPLCEILYLYWVRSKRSSSGSDRIAPLESVCRTRTCIWIKAFIGKNHVIRCSQINEKKFDKSVTAQASVESSRHLTLKLTRKRWRTSTCYHVTACYFTIGSIKWPK